MNEQWICENIVRQVGGACGGYFLSECRKVVQSFVEKSYSILPLNAFLLHPIWAGFGLEALQYRGDDLILTRRIREMVPPVAAVAC